MRAVVVEQQHLGRGLRVAREDVPARHHELGAGLEDLRVRQAARRDDHHVGVFREHVLRIGQVVEAQRHAVLLALGEAPVGDAEELGAAARAGGEPDLAARLARRLEQHHLVAARGRDPRGLEAGGARSHHDDLPLRPVAPADRVGHGGLAAGRRVVDAERLVALVDAVEAVGGADAGADLVLAAGRDLARDVRVGDVGAGHADEVELARGDRVARGRDVVDARGVEDRQAERGLDLAREVEVRRGGRAVDRDHVGERRVGLDVAADHVEEVDLAARHEAAADLEAFGAREALVPGLVGDHADADDEVRADRGADRGQHLEGEAQAVVQAAALGVGPPVGRGRPEAVEQVAVGLDLDAIEAGRLHALRGRGVVPDDAREVPVLGLLGERAMRRLAHRRGRQHRQPVAVVPVGPPAEVGDLDHHRSAMLVAVVGEPPEPRHDLVLVGVQVAEAAGELGATIAEPAVMVSAMPPLAFSTW